MSVQSSTKGRGAAHRHAAKQCRTDGIYVAKKELDAILDAEKAAAEAIDNAKAKAREMMIASEKEAERLLQEALESAHSEARALAKRSADAVSDLEKVTLEEAHKEIARLTEVANARFDEAVGVVVSRIKKAV